jgi:uncharacterized protein (TIGR00369 family)
MNELQRAMLLGPKEAKHWVETFNTFVHLTALGSVGGHIVGLDDEHVVLEMEISDASRQPFGLLHGGVSLLLAETAASMHSAWLTDIKKFAPVGVDINGTHVGGASEGLVRATGHVIRAGRSMIFHEVKILHVPTDRLLSVCRVTNFLKPHG